MGINIILSLIMGIAMTAIIGSQVAPSIIEQIKVAKVENTISNQNLIKDAIVRYIKMEKKIPKDVEELTTFGLLSGNNNNNPFGGEYEIDIDRKKGTLKIITTINDEVASKYFSNSVKFPEPPICVGGLVGGLCESKKWETFYLLDEETFKAIPPPKVGSIEYIEDKFTKVEEVGKKFDETTLVGGEKDFIVDIPNNTVTEYVYNFDTKEWDKGTPRNIGGFGNDTNVFVNNDLVHCKDTTLSDQEVLVVNENTSLGEIIWVAPSTNYIQTKIFTNNYTPNNICTSKVTSMNSMFLSRATFNQPLSRWDVSNVTNMELMFLSASSFNQPLNNWNVSKVTSMQRMFSGARTFNQPLNNWDVSNVTNMENMFNYVVTFNQDINNWDVSNVTNMESMFSNANAFDQPLNNWNVSNVTNMKSMFLSAISFNQPLNNWDVSNVTNMTWMFYSAKAFDQPLNNWDVSKVTNMSYMFYNANAFDQPLNNWNVSNVTNMTWMFIAAISFNQPLNNWNVSNVINMEFMFNSAKVFNQPLNNWNVSKVAYMNNMFEHAGSFNQDISSWCVSKITTKPNNFDSNTTAWPKTLNANGKIALQPQWGCPIP